MKFFLKIFLLFILVIQLGAMLHEGVRTITAKTINYQKADFANGELYFYNDSMNKCFDKFWETNRAELETGKDFPNKNKWLELRKQNDHDHAIIEISGRLFTFTVFLIGLLILFVNRKNRKETFATTDWVGVILSLFLMQQVFLSSVHAVTHKFIWCDDASIYNVLHLPIIKTEWCITFIGSIICSIIVFGIVPKEKRISFFCSGLLGGLVGITIWLFWTGKLLT
jgi:hypothetical protein